jgi:hypothetical protein
VVCAALDAGSQTLKARVRRDLISASRLIATSTCLKSSLHRLR